MKKKLFFKDYFFVDEKGNIIGLFHGLSQIEKNEAEAYIENKKAEFYDIYNSLSDNLKNYYIIFKDISNKNLKIGTGTKFGGVFRVYERNTDRHSRWIVLPISKNTSIEVYEFLSKNRVAHSTRKSLVFAVLDNKKIIYIESKWRKL